MLPTWSNYRKIRVPCVSLRSGKKLWSETFIHDLGSCLQSGWYNKRFSQDSEWKLQMIGCGFQCQHFHFRLIQQILHQILTFFRSEQWRIQDFPRGGRQLPKVLLFFNFLPKTAWKWKNLDPRGGARPWRPPWIRQCRVSDFKIGGKN